MTKYGSDKIVTSLVDHFDWYILPVVNPDGFQYTHTQVFKITARKGGTEGPERYATKSDYFMLTVATNLKILSRCLYHNFIKVQIHQVNYNVYLNMFIWIPYSPDITADLLAWEKWHRHASSVISQLEVVILRCGVIFHFVAYFRGLRSLSKWVFNFKYLWHIPLYDVLVT